MGKLTVPNWKWLKEGEYIGQSYPDNLYRRAEKAFLKAKKEGKAIVWTRFGYRAFNPSFLDQMKQYPEKRKLKEWLDGLSFREIESFSEIEKYFTKKYFYSTGVFMTIPAGNK